MLRNSIVQASWKRLFVCESTQKSQPVSQSLRLILQAHFLLLVVDDFNDTTHDIGEEYNSTKHVTNCHQYFSVAFRVVISITDGSQGRHRVVPTHNESLINRLIFHVELIPEGLFFFIFVVLDDHVPNASTEVGNDDG
jgi:hypothetical protein